MNRDLPELLKAEEVAKIFKVCLRTVKQWQAEGILRAVKIGRVVRYLRSDIEELLSENIVRKS